MRRTGRLAFRAFARANAAATVKLKPGKHIVAVKMAGYKDWSREITTDIGSDARLAAALEKTN